MKKLLVATDLSARSDRALQRALAIAHERQADVEILHVVDNDWPRKIVDQLEESARTARAEQIAAVPQSREVRVLTTIIRGQDYVDILKPAEEMAKQAGIAFTSEIAVGDIAPTLAWRAEQLHCDEIIMGTRGMSAIRSLVLGSVATKVVHLAAMPVTLVK